MVEKLALKAVFFRSHPKPYLYAVKLSIYIMNSILLFGMPGGMEWVIIAFAVLVLFGAKKIPEFAKGLGQGIRQFKDAVKDVKKEVDEGTRPTGKIEEGDK